MIRVAPDGTLSLGTTAQVLVAPTLVDLAVELRYRPADPFAVTLCFTKPDPRGSTRDIIWLVDRGALGTGHATGETCGDVRVTRLDALDLVVVELAHGSAAATTIRFPATAMDEFLAATYRAVPLGSESLDVDGAIERILRAA